MDVVYRAGTLADIPLLKNVQFYNRASVGEKLEGAMEEFTSYNREWFLSIAEVRRRIVAYDIRFARSPEVINIYAQDILCEFHGQGILDELTQFAHKRTTHGSYKYVSWLAPTTLFRDLHVAAEYQGVVVAYHETMWVPQVNAHLPMLCLTCKTDAERERIEQVRGRFPRDLEISRRPQQDHVMQVTRSGESVGEVRMERRQDHVFLQPLGERGASATLACCVVGMHVAEQGQLLGLPHDRPEILSAFCAFGFQVVGFLGERAGGQSIVFVQHKSLDEV